MVKTDRRLSRMSRFVCFLALLAIIPVLTLAGQIAVPADTADKPVENVETGPADSSATTQSPDEVIPADTSDRITDQYIEIASDSSWWYRKIDNNAFDVGERLEFSVKYGKLPAGNAVLEIPRIIDWDGYRCYEVLSTAQSNDVVSVFYRVRDTVKTIIDVDGIFPRKFWKKLHEGGYQTDKTTLFDQKNHLAITDSDTIPTYTFVQDAFSSLYFARTQELVPGQELYIDNHTSKKNFPLTLKVLKKEKVKVPAGEFKCVVVEPVMRAEGIFKAKGRIWVWLTDDEYKMPVLMKTEVFFLGSISAQLKSFVRGSGEETGE
jgi:hypothetical protein